MSHFSLKDDTSKVTKELNKIEGRRHMKKKTFLLSFKVGKVGEENHMQSTAYSFAANCSCNVPAVLWLCYMLWIFKSS